MKVKTTISTYYSYLFKYTFYFDVVREINHVWISEIHTYSVEKYPGAVGCLLQWRPVSSEGLG